MALYNMLAVVTVCLAILVDYAVHGCRCAQLGIECRNIQQADVVLRGTVVSRPQKAGSNGLLSYTVDALFYKSKQEIDQYQYPTEPTAKHPREISFITAGSAAGCEVLLELEEEYLIGLYEDDMGQLTADSCRLFRNWKAVTKEEESLLEAGCVDTCDGTCNEKTQACIFDEGEHKCADVTCDPSPCGYNEFCNLEESGCTQEPCPTIALCRHACNGKCGDDERCILNEEIRCVQAPCLPIAECVKDVCASCGEFQECLSFEGGPKPSPLLRAGEQDDSEVWYCADFCHPDRCEDNEECELLPTSCASQYMPCPTVAVCKEKCSGGCDESQECVFYPGKGYTCAHQTCDPSPCAENETCSMQKILPPVVICSSDNCNGKCNDSQVCRQYQGNGKWYCSETCANSPCEEGEKCVTKQSKWCRRSGFEGCPKKRRCKRKRKG